MLSGKIVYRLELQDCSSDMKITSRKMKKKKKRRKTERSNVEQGSVVSKKAKRTNITTTSTNSSSRHSLSMDQQQRNKDMTCTTNTPMMEPWQSAGFFFIPLISAKQNAKQKQQQQQQQQQQRTYEEDSKEYLLSLPQHLLKMACDAARFQLKVQIHQFSFFELSLSPVTSPFSEYDQRISQWSRSNVDAIKLPKSRSLLQVHNNGMTIIETSRTIPNLSLYDEVCKKNHKNDDYFVCTLAQFRHNESQKNDTTATSTKKINNGKDIISSSTTITNRNDSNMKHNIFATVDAVSPIISMEPKDPFALIELYDDNTTENRALENEHESSPTRTSPSTNDTSTPPKTPCSSIVVLKGSNPLSCHSGIFPGDKILFHQVVRKQWQVPNTFCKNAKSAEWKYLGKNGRIPSHVFVVRDAKNIVWKAQHIQDQRNENREFQKTVIYPPIPSTPIPLVSLRGTISKKELLAIPTRNCCKIHWIEVLSDHPNSDGNMATNDNKECTYICHRLYLTHFPMSSALQFSLHPGAFIQATNIHHLCPLTAESSLATIPNSKNHDVNRRYQYGAIFGTCLRSTIVVQQLSSIPPTSPLSAYGVVPFLYSSIKRPYHEYIYRKQVADILSSLREISKDIVTTSNRTAEAATSNNATIQIQLLDAIVTTLFNHCKTQYLKHFHRKPKNIDYDQTYDCDILYTSEDEEETLDTSMKSVPPSCRGKMTVITKQRNPYAEFFDHAIDHPKFNDDDDHYCGCSMSILEEQPRQKVLPNILGLDQLRTLGSHSMMDRLDEMITSSSSSLEATERETCFELSGGWTSSIHMMRKDIMKAIQERNNSIPHEHGDDDHLFYILGIVLETNQESLLPSMIRDEKCQLPVHCSTTSVEGNLGCKDDNDFQLNSFALGDTFLGCIDQMIVSCLCIATPSAQRTKSRPIRRNDNVDHIANSSKENDEATLPPLHYHHHHHHHHHQVTSPSCSLHPEFHGGCSVIRIQDYLFILSVQLRCSPCYLPSAIPSKTRRSLDALPHDIYSIDESLRNPIKVSSSSSSSLISSPNGDNGNKKQRTFIQSILVRQHYRYAKLANHLCKSCILTLSQQPIVSDIVSDEVSCAQSIDLKVTIRCQDTSKLSLLKSALSKVMSLDVNDGGACDTTANGCNDFHLIDEQLALGMSWWMIADTGQVCALVAGGWDEVTKFSSDALQQQQQQLKQHPTITRTAIAVQVPVSTITIAPRGYVRFSCALDELNVSFITLPKDKEEMAVTRAHMILPSLCNQSPRKRLFDFIGGTKFRSGSHDRRPLRRLVLSGNKRRSIESNILLAQRQQSIIGELQSIPSSISSGIPIRKLSDLFQCMCEDLRDQQQYQENQQTTTQQRQRQLAPSLVQMISGGHFLGVSFCQVQCICTQCHKDLVMADSVKAADFRYSNKNKINGGNNNFSIARRGTSPHHHQRRQQQPTRATNYSTSFHGLNSTNNDKSYIPLRCPTNNNCSIECYGIKWECSGLLDDGTGQAILYAEGDTALTLLGMNSQTIQWIEEGVWYCNSSSSTTTNSNVRVGSPLSRSPSNSSNDGRGVAGRICFQKSIGPPLYLQKAIQTAKLSHFLSLKNHRSSQNIRNNRYHHHQHQQQQQQNINDYYDETAVQILQHLTPAIRSEYLLQFHCRYLSNRNNGTLFTSSSPRCNRSLDYLVRCKPLKDPGKEYHHDNQQQKLPFNDSLIQLYVPDEKNKLEDEPMYKKVVRRVVPTYSLPPLRLNLVDCVIRNKN